MLAGALLTLFFVWNGSQTFEELEAKRSIMLRQHTQFYISNWGTHFDDHALKFFMMAGLILEMLFMLFYVITLHK